MLTLTCKWSRRVLWHSIMNEYIEEMGTKRNSTRRPNQKKQYWFSHLFVQTVYLLVPLLCDMCFVAYASVYSVTFVISYDRFYPYSSKNRNAAPSYVPFYVMRMYVHDRWNNSFVDAKSSFPAHMVTYSFQQIGKQTNPFERTTFCTASRFLHTNWISNGVIPYNGKK